MTTHIYNIYKIIPLALLSLLVLNCTSVKAQDDKFASLMKCLSAAKKTPAKGEALAVSIIKQDNFDADKIAAVDLSHVGCGPLSQENTFHLTCGSALFNPKKDIVVLTALAKISIGSGSAVCVLKPEPGVISVYNLHSGGDKKVVIEVNGQPVILPAGMHATVCYEGSEFSAVNPARQIAYRNLKTITLPNGICMYSTEFSIPSAIAHITCLQSMLSSKNKDEQKLADQLLKNSVILEYICNSDEPFAVTDAPTLKQLSVAKTYIDASDIPLQTSLVQ
jgi:hypothetical protein